MIIGIVILILAGLYAMATLGTMALLITGQARDEGRVGITQALLVIFLTTFLIFMMIAITGGITVW
jgi:hypothetical protein